jgi:hypothetical protein
MMSVGDDDGMMMMMRESDGRWDGEERKRGVGGEVCETREHCDRPGCAKKDEVMRTDM